MNINKKEIIGIILMIVGLIMVLGLIYWTNFTDKGTIEVEVDCYDKLGNKMIGLTCIEERIENTQVYHLAWGLLIFFIGEIMYLFGRWD